jgi:hypothetical protein
MAASKQEPKSRGRAARAPADKGEASPKSLSAAEQRSVAFDLWASAASILRVLAAESKPMTVGRLATALLAAADPTSGSGRTSSAAAPAEGNVTGGMYRDLRASLKAMRSRAQVRCDVHSRWSLASPPGADPGHGAGGSAALPPKVPTVRVDLGKRPSGAEGATGAAVTPRSRARSILRVSTAPPASRGPRRAGSRGRGRRPAAASRPTPVAESRPTPPVAESGRSPRGDRARAENGRSPRGDRARLPRSTPATPNNSPATAPGTPPAPAPAPRTPLAIDLGAAPAPAVETGAPLPSAPGPAALPASGPGNPSTPGPASARPVGGPEAKRSLAARPERVSRAVAAATGAPAADDAPEAEWPALSAGSAKRGSAASPAGAWGAATRPAAPGDGSQTQGAEETASAWVESDEDGFASNQDALGAGFDALSPQPAQNLAGGDGAAGGVPAKMPVSAPLAGPERQGQGDGDGDGAKAGRASQVAAGAGDGGSARPTSFPWPGGALPPGAGAWHLHPGATAMPGWPAAPAGWGAAEWGPDPYGRGGRVGHGAGREWAGYAGLVGPGTPPCVIVVVDAVSFYDALRITVTGCFCLKRLIFTTPNLLVKPSSPIDYIDIVPDDWVSAVDMANNDDATPQPDQAPQNDPKPSTVPPGPATTAAGLSDGLPDGLRGAPAPSNPSSGSAASEVKAAPIPGDAGAAPGAERLEGLDEGDRADGGYGADGEVGAPVPVTAAFRILSTLESFLYNGDLRPGTLVYLYSRDPLAHHVVFELARWHVRCDLFSALPTA